MECIIFQKFTLNYLFLLLFLAVSIFRKKVQKPLFESMQKKAMYFFLMYIVILSYFLAIIPFLIVKCLSKRRNKKQQSEKALNNIENKTSYLHNKDKYAKKFFFKYTILVSIFDFLGEACIFVFYFLNDNMEIINLYALRTYLIFNIMMQNITSYIVLKTYLYKHQWLSIFMNIFCILSCLIMDIIMIVKRSITDFRYYIFILMRLIRISLFSFENSYTKMALDSEFLSPYSILLFKAVSETILLGIFSIPFIFIKINDDNIINESIFVGFKEYLNGIKLLYSFIRFFCEFLYRLFIIIIIDRFSPNHLALAHIVDSFGSTLSVIIQSAIDNKSILWINYAIFIVYIILIISAMIYNEIFIINRCGLSEKTKLFLDIKLNEEQKNQYLLPEDVTEKSDRNESIDETSIL